jgi:hypothetical protein
LNRGKKLRLRPWVKNTLWAIFVISVLIILINIDYNYKKDSVESCIESGRDTKICEELWK